MNRMVVGMRRGGAGWMMNGGAGASRARRWGVQHLDRDGDIHLASDRQSRMCIRDKREQVHEAPGGGHDDVHIGGDTHI